MQSSGSSRRRLSTAQEFLVCPLHVYLVGKVNVNIEPENPARMNSGGGHDECLRVVYCNVAENVFNLDIELGSTP